MDKSKSGIFRKHRIASVPCLEPLEGRRLLAAGASQSGIREVTNNGATELIITGTNRADTIDIVDKGTGQAGNVTVTLNGGSTYTSQGAITLIEVQGRGGNDRVSYELDGDLVNSQAVLVDLGAGNDQFTANLNGAIANPSGLDLEAYGDGGNDTMTVNHAAPTASGTFISYLDGGAGNDNLTFRNTGDIAAGASVIPALSGGSGNDTITSDYSGQVLGNYIYSLSIDGGSGNDKIDDQINVGAGSTGTIGTSASIPAVVTGGQGNDQIRYNVAVDPSATQAVVNATAVGGAGKDSVQRSSNVLGDKSNESDSLLS